MEKGTNKRHYLVIIMLFFTGLIGSSQVLTVQKTQENTNGDYYRIELGTTSGTSGCSLQQVVVEIGALEVSNFYTDLPGNASYTVTGSGTSNTVVTIKDIPTSSNSSSVIGSLLGVYFPFDRSCINTTTQGIGVKLYCQNDLSTVLDEVSDEDFSINPTTVNNTYAYIAQQDPVYTQSTDLICFSDDVIRYYGLVTNYIPNKSNTFKITDAQVHIDLADCANVAGLYHHDSFSPITYTEGASPTTGKKRITFSPPASYTGYGLLEELDLYLSYPCTCTGTPLVPTIIVEPDLCDQSDSAFTKTDDVINGSVFSQGQCPGGCSGGSLVWDDTESKFPCTACQEEAYVNFDLKVLPSNNYSDLSLDIAIPPYLQDKIGSMVTDIDSQVTYTYDSNDPEKITHIRYDYPNIPDSTAVSITPQLKFDSFNYSGAEQITYTLRSNSPTQQDLITDQPIQIQTEDCELLFTKYSYIRKKGDSFSSNTVVSGSPGDVYTYRMVIKNTGSKDFIGELTSVIPVGLSYAGGFKYAAVDNLVNAPVFMELSDNKITGVPELGQAEVEIISGGTNDIVKVKNFNNFKLPKFCDFDKHLVLEFDVKIVPSAIQGYVNMTFDINPTNPQETFMVTNTSGQSASVLVLGIPGVEIKMYTRCSDANEWTETDGFSPVNVAQGGEVQFKMELVNTGTQPLTNIAFYNLKPKVGDHLLVGDQSRNSEFAIDYDCDPGSTVQVTSGSGNSPSHTVYYSNDSASLSLSAVNFGAGANCSLTANWMKVSIDNLVLNPTNQIEVVFKSVVNGSGVVGQKAYNSFTFYAARLDNIPIGTESTIPGIIKIASTGCNPPLVDFTDCTLTAAGIDGTFNSCESLALTNTFSSTVDCGAGWSIKSGSPDLWKLPISGDIIFPYPQSRTDYVYPLGLNEASEDGGVIAASLAAANGRAHVEGFKAIVNHLVPGSRYRIDFQQINLTHLSTINTQVQWKVTFGDPSDPSNVRLSPMMPVVIGQAPYWSDVSFEFVAKDDTQELSFVANTDNATIVASQFFFALGYPGFVYAGIDGIKVLPLDTECVIVPCEECSSFDLDEGETYVVTGWVQQEAQTQPAVKPVSYEDVSIEVTFLDQSDLVLGTVNNFIPSGEIIDGWQRIIGEFTVPLESATIKIDLVNTSVNGDKSYFDDIRIHPRDANMKSFVYDQSTQRLMSELDENNYSTYYEYDQEGGLIRIKKETERGVFTIQETRSANVKKGE